MCRFLLYKGRDILMSDLLLRSSQSLIRQSYKAREREEPLNGDGFGVGWYAHAIDPTPGLFTSVQPAWGNRNLARLAPKIRSTCLFAHVRAASPGSPISELNCHPFQHARFLWMHNGRIAGFRRMKRHIRQRISDEFYDNILGTTDSEHAFALFLTQLKRHMQDYDLADMLKALRATIAKIERWSSSYKIEEPSDLNFALTDGYNLIATRYSSGGTKIPQSLYLAKGERIEVRNGQYRMIPRDDRIEAVVIASEPLTEQRDDWESVPENHVVTVSPELHVRIDPL
ncbi:MAG: class II glutamine amidotransferase [Gammaproteobacteria bacterium]|nr:class II glutamine amidotransferase [Gammaproteobacteria bacterium]